MMEYEVTTEETNPEPPRRIFPNGAICDRCDANLTPRCIRGEYACTECMTEAEVLLFETLNKPEYEI